MTRQEESPQGRCGSLAPHTIYETEAAELTDLSAECTFKCGETISRRLWDAKDDCTAHADDPSAPDTVLYLAYGSNMCAQTFLGMRKIKPLSQMNVYVPSLRLTFSLPGIAYMEPCFANVEYRDGPAAPDDGRGHPDERWDGCLVGVVYEVTKADWRNIMRTEGGGASYQEIVVPCIPLSTSVSGAAPLPGTFMARTLHAPRTPNSKRPNHCSWWDRLTTGPYRPRDDYAQPSLRYIKLLRAGAREHDLPQVYKDYLDSTQPYTPTHIGQKIGKFVFILLFGPLFLLMIRISALFADEQGQAPKALAMMMTIMSNTMWIGYDHVLKPIFGEGERTVVEGDAKRETANSVSEKRALLEAYSS
ncbi:gliotoxin biosynthesis protein GliK [Cordyceps fumosorosea ARSEF 2679]|uniref:gamma-glutamylcyclotransferase n=1 Tax=Cordyceps fumosorosea (strain ARSEF 2679) TaxID=1081104 RepID=A0A167NN09_CORFA|nr:gliotoxin biosynthesis protein GliK [Cordyceps fumosorosea ARSEF 2679]OAA55737.1 gliotoxin biosynthesis protein GliK [Cordyceps fumosorosea ARSEF 2679]